MENANTQTNKRKAGVFSIVFVSSFSFFFVVFLQRGRREREKEMSEGAHTKWERRKRK
jgi:hypothetical protein